MSAGAILGDADWFDLGITISAGGHSVPFADVFVALSQGQSHLLLPDGTYFALDKPELKALGRLIEEARALQDVPGDELRISRFQAGLWQQLTELGVVGHQAAAWRRQVAGLLAVGSVGPRQPPAGLRATLRPYQLDGFSWLAFLWEHKLGGILADDMGLGKTLQSLALICHARHEEPDGAPFLIVAPTSVVPNWAAEAARFAPGLRVVAVGETEARRGRPLREMIAGAGGVVTCYALMRLDVADHAAESGPDPRASSPNHLQKPIGAPGGPGFKLAIPALRWRTTDGAPGAAIDHRARAVPRSRPVQGLLRQADRAVS